MFSANDEVAITGSWRRTKYRVLEDQTCATIKVLNTADKTINYMSAAIFEPWIGKWDTRFLNLAEHIASWSQDPSTKVGAVIVNPDRTIVSMGYNGFPRGVDDWPERYQDRPTKHKMVVHAEMNAILTASGKNLQGTTLYVSPLYPCSTCAGAIIQAGIKRVVMRIHIIKNPLWEEEFSFSRDMFEEADVELLIDDKRPHIHEIETNCTCNSAHVLHCHAQHEPHCPSAGMVVNTLGFIQAQGKTDHQTEAGCETFYQEANTGITYYACGNTAAYVGGD